MNGTTTSDSSTIKNGSRTVTKVISIPGPEPNKLIIELTNLSESSLRTVKRELKVIIEDYGWKKMISGSIQVTEGE